MNVKNNFKRKKIKGKNYKRGKTTPDASVRRCRLKTKESSEAPFLAKMSKPLHFYRQDRKLIIS